MLIVSRALAAARDRSGFTLVETLVAMVTGVIVSGALFSILEISTKQSARLSNVAQATQIGRTAMTHVVDELHSACLKAGFVPVIGKGVTVKGSTASKLIFWNGYSEEAEIPSTGTSATGARADEIVFNEAKGTLTDNTYYATGTNAEGEYTANFNTPSRSVLLAEHVSKAELEGKTAEVFQYYEYAKTSTSATTEAASTLTPMGISGATELTEAGAKKAASVVVSFRTAPYKKEANLSATAQAGTSADLSTQSIFAFSAPNSESTIEAVPCE